MEEKTREDRKGRVTGQGGSRNGEQEGSGCLQLLEILEILELYWNFKVLLEILLINYSM